ncbi:hypothetical protein KB559_13490 [Paenibacillus sp. Marseille-P2973]|uniref:hypothetical protein n=1 Tax=Paenibacillus sp. Marseille-P2973 TaxID=1871032 RepID=UPI001B381DC1|nr:hypothetical protein [Paenibacillus sp. Marseille-P2973]MBQ4899858.1 hypothetical protein [Paenibacillus sp. Marseille-P2973]
MPFIDKIVNIQTPGRLYALCKLVQYKKYSRDELENLLQPRALNNNSNQFKEVFALATRGQLIKETEDKTLMLTMEVQDIHDPTQFRHALIQKIYSNPDLIFNKFTAWYMSRGEHSMGDKKLAGLFFTEVSKATTQNTEYNDTNIVAWRTWAQYLGLGYNHNGSFLPNPAMRIKEEILIKPPEFMGERVSASQFFQWIAKTFPELDGGIYNQSFQKSYSAQRLSFALSMGLRTLHDLGIIELQFIPDSKDVWYLHKNDLHVIQDKISNVVIRG